MIICGYHGIGKSSLSKSNTKFIDLDIESFEDYGQQLEKYKCYCKVAESLSQQGYIVFISYSSEIFMHLKSLKKTKDDVTMCAPCLELKDAWIEKLRSRYEKDKTDKSLLEWRNANIDYEWDIEKIKRCDFNILWICSMDYNLYNIVECCCKE